MNRSFTLRLPSLPGWGTALVVATLWQGLCPLKGAQSSFGNTYIPVAGAPVAPPWPMVDWGIEPAVPGREGLGWPVGKESIPGLGNAAEAVVLSIRSAKGDVALNFGSNRDLGLGPVVSVVAPIPGEGEMTGPNGKEAGSIRLGNVTFNQAANSLNAWGGGVATDADLSRQFQGAATVSNVAPSSEIGGWAIAALAAIAVIIAMAISYYENDRDDRKRRRSSRKSSRRHRRAS